MLMPVFLKTQALPHAVAAGEAAAEFWQQLVQAVSPLKASGPEAVLLVLDKSPSQEDFIPGSLGNAPFKSTDMGGPLMRDVKNFICRRLNLEGMVADDFGLDLLVAGNLVDLNLPILGVYREVRP
ncbi:E3 ubiquitin-protein ligase UBR4, partial [Haematococcus lacustris]